MYATKLYNTTFIFPLFVLIMDPLQKGNKTLVRVFMTAIVAYKSEMSNDDPSTAMRLAETLGIDPEEWRIVFKGTIRGKSQILHYFDMVMESEINKTLAPVIFLRSTDENKASKIMLHKVKSDDVSANLSFVMTDFSLEPKERILCEMSHIKVVYLGNLNGDKLISDRFHNMFYEVSEAVKRNTDDTIFSEKPKIFRRKNRDRTKIIQDVLESVLYMKSASITQLIYKCNLNYKSAKNLLNEMISRDLLKIVEYSSVGKRYELTDRGRKTLERLQFYVNL